MPSQTRDERRFELVGRLAAIEGEMLSWERARVAAQSDEDRAAAVAQLVVLRARWTRVRDRLEALRDQLTLPWLGERRCGRAS